MITILGTIPYGAHGHAIQATDGERTLTIWRSTTATLDEAEAAVEALRVDMHVLESRAAVHLVEYAWAGAVRAADRLETDQIERSRRVRSL